MAFDSKLMSISYSLKEHPILEEDISYRLIYLEALEYFINKYSDKDEFILETLRIYKSIFLGNDIDKYYYDKDKIKNILKEVTSVKFKKFRLFTYRFAFLYDCLLINSITNVDKAINILNEVKSICKKRHYKKLDLLFDILYKGKIYNNELDKINNQIKFWEYNKKFLMKKQLTILITANMSAGKSTLINAVVGKRVNRTMNGACTSKLHYIYNKAFEDELNYKLDGVLKLDVNEEELLKNNINNKENKIQVSTYFNSLLQNQYKLCIIDTPGVNSSLNFDHAKITKDAILEGRYDKILYLVNAENSGTDDDIRYLQFIKQHVREEKVIFILNKLDSFKSSEDSIEESIRNLKDELINIGFKDPVICPVSSYAGRLAKKKILKEELNKKENRDYIYLQEIFEDESYNLHKFYPKEISNYVHKIYDRNDNEQDIKLLINCGILCLERVIAKGAEI